jgi:hypothetical protein
VAVVSEPASEQKRRNLESGFEGPISRLVTADYAPVG